MLFIIPDFPNPYLLFIFYLIQLFIIQLPPPIDLFSLYILFSHFRPRDSTRGNSFFQMSSYARANLRITNEKQKENSREGITWSEMGKQNVQAEKVYSNQHKRESNIISTLAANFACVYVLHVACTFLTRSLSIS